MAILNNTLITGNLKVNGVGHFQALKVNGQNISVLSGSINGNNSNSSALVTVAQAVEYITDHPAANFTIQGVTNTAVATVGSTASSGYYTVSAKVKAAVTAGTAGWFSSSSTLDASTATQVGKIAAGVITNTSGGTPTVTISAGAQIKIGAGWYPNDLYYTAEAAQAAPTLTGDASTGNVLSGKKFYSNSYTLQTGTMTNNGAVSQTLTTSTTSYTIPAGYHNGSGTVSITTEEKSASGSGDITPSSNKVLSKVSVRAAATFTMTGSAVTDVVTVGTLDSGYYPISAKVKGTISAGTTGWFSSSGAKQASTATQVGKIAAGTITPNTSGGTAESTTLNCGKQIKIGAGYYPSDKYYNIQTAAAGSSGTITITQQNGTNVAGKATANVQDGVTKNGYVTTAGWIPNGTTDVYTLSYDSTNKCVHFVFEE